MCIRDSPPALSHRKLRLCHGLFLFQPGILGRWRRHGRPPESGGGRGRDSEKSKAFSEIPRPLPDIFTGRPTSSNHHLYGRPLVPGNSMPSSLLFLSLIHIWKRNKISWITRQRFKIFSFSVKMQTRMLIVKDRFWSKLEQSFPLEKKLSQIHRAF